MRFFTRIALFAAMLLSTLGGYAQTLELGNDTAVCNNLPFVIDAGPGFIDYQWSTGSSAQSIVANGSGTYSITVTDTANNIQVDSIHILLHSTPIAVFLGNNECLGTANPFVNLSRIQDSVTWLWDFADGTTDTAFAPTHVFGTYGVKQVTLHVTSIYGCTDSVTNPVEVFGPPMVDAGINDTINLGDSIQLTPATQARIFKWQPQYAISDTTVINPLAYPQVTTLFTLSVTDSLGCRNSDTVLVYVNLPPVANDDNAVFSTGGTGVIQVQNNDSDPNGDALTTSIVIAPHHGTAVLLNGDSIQYTPVSKYSGDDTIIYRICDTGNPPLCATALVVISVSNIPPNANNDTLITPVNTSGTVNVIANDSDPNQEVISISEVGAAQHGTVNDLGNGVFSYTPNEGYIGLDTFFYLVCNNGSPILCDTAYVFVEVINKALKVSNSFSPNGDGVVDYFVIEGLSLYPNNHLLVFSRWGDKIYEKDHYNSDWDGKRGSNDDAPDGIYFYQLSLGDGSKDITGWIMLKR